MLNDYRPLLKNKNFILIWTSQILSQITINIINFLLLLRLFGETGSTIATSFLWIVYALPAIFIGPVAASLVDMADRRKILVISNLLQSLFIFLYALVHGAALFLLYGVALVYSFLNNFYVPAEMATLPYVVSQKRLANANALFFITQYIALIFGFGIAGLLTRFLGFANSLFLCAGLLFLAFIAVYFLPKMQPEKDFPTSFEDAFFKFFSHIKEGYLFIKTSRTVLAPFLLLMGLQVAAAVIAINSPLLAEELLKIHIELAGVVMVVPVGIGAATGAILIPRFLKKGVRKQKIVNASLMVAVFALFVFTFIVPELPQNLRVGLGMLNILFLGLSFIGILIPSQTFLQENTPKSLHGRVFGNYWFLVTIATVFPVILSGTVTELLGSRILLVLLAAFAFSALLFSKNHTAQFFKRSSR